MTKHGQDLPASNEWREGPVRLAGQVDGQAKGVREIAIAERIGELEPGVAEGARRPCAHPRRPQARARLSARRWQFRGRPWPAHRPDRPAGPDLHATRSRRGGPGHAWSSTGPARRAVTG